MLINGHETDAKTLSTTQLLTIEKSIDIFVFKQGGEESFEPTYKADPKQFRKLINAMVSYKRDLMQYFQQQYDNRYNLIRANLVKLDQYDDYLYDDQWNQYDDDLTQILEKNNSVHFDLGIIALAVALAIQFDFTSADAQTAIKKRAVNIAS